MNLINENIPVYELCLEKWGADSQYFMLIEECAEVIQAISKLWRKDPLAVNRLIKELVDLQLMLDQIKYILQSKGLEKQYDIEMKMKLERLKMLLNWMDQDE